MSNWLHLEVPVSAYKVTISVPTYQEFEIKERGREIEKNIGIGREREREREREIVRDIDIGRKVDRRED